MAGKRFQYRVIRRSPEEARDDLLRLWDTNLQVKGSVEARFEALYHRAPDPAKVVLLLEAIPEGNAPGIVGTAGIAVRRFLVDGREARAALLVDLAVDQPHRHLLPALKLVRGVREYALEHFDFVYGFPNRMAEGVLKRAGYRELGRITRYARVLRHESYLERLGADYGLARKLHQVGEKLGLHRIAAAVTDGARMTLDRLSSPRPRSCGKLEWLERVDERFDALWRAASPGYRVVGQRTARFLSWRGLAHTPWQYAALFARSNGALRAYAAIQQVGDVAFIRDLFGFVDDIGPLLGLLIKALYERGAASISIRLLGSERIASLLESHHFHPREADRIVVTGIGQLDEAASRSLAKFDRWHLLDGDEDA